MEPLLGIVFSSVFIGKIKGTARDRVKFTTKNIQIPFQAKSNEFIFLELQKPISWREEVKFKELMAEVKKKNKSVALLEPLFWNEALPLQHFVLEECSFLYYLYCSFQLEQQQKANKVLVKNEPLPQRFQEANRALQEGGRMTCPNPEEVKRIPQTPRTLQEMPRATRKK
ncbi:sentrin-specific protease 7-like isoform X5 [Tachyglossus aculeatus]|uniref:sentrin-specific protease 7-like isoform X5 n=1 Tax=Tachyglossus aculeatus TaxID=9261 RepID=UPI0018F3C61F|nr:sentrin-specific protease 7-like isoform X5 [Tachyglossus aculeatus]